jgi:uncharacterized protein with PIN domain
MSERCPICLLPVEAAEREREAIRLVGENDYRRIKTAWRCAGCGFWVWSGLLKEAAAASDEQR